MTIKKFNYSELVKLTSSNKNYLSKLKSSDPSISIIGFDEPDSILNTLLKSKLDAAHYDIECRMINDETKNNFLTDNWFKLDTSNVKIGAFIKGIDEMIGVLTFLTDSKKHLYKTNTFVAKVNENLVLNSLLDFFTNAYNPKHILLSLDKRFYEIDGADSVEAPYQYYYSEQKNVAFMKSNAKLHIKDEYGITPDSVADFMRENNYGVYFDAGKTQKSIVNEEGENFLYYYPIKTEEAIKSKYQDGHSIREIGIELGEDQRVIKKVLESHSIDIDSSRKKRYNPDDEFAAQVEDMYLNKKMMIRDIAAELGRDRHTITRYLDRTDFIEKKSRTFNETEKDEIERMYVVLMMPINEIAEDFECSKGKIQPILLERGVQIRYQENNVPEDHHIEEFHKLHHSTKLTMKEYCYNNGFVPGTFRKLYKAKGYELRESKYDADDKLQFYQLYKSGRTMQSISDEHKICSKILSLSLNEIKEGVTQEIKKRSAPEIDICSVLDEHNIEYLSNHKINGVEVDIYVPSHDFAIEYNGLFWHREGLVKMTTYNYKGRNKKYHLNKTEVLSEKGIFLMHIFEDEYLNNRELIINKIKYILKIDAPDMRTIRASKCIIKEIEALEKNIFLNDYHIQGQDVAIIKYGAYYNDELIAVMTFNKNMQFDWTLNRFAIKHGIKSHGIFGRVLKFAANEHKMKKVVSYGDRRSVNPNKNIYLSNNFELASISDPTYFYIDIRNLRRMHKSNWRKENIIARYPHFKDKNMSETEMMIELGYDRIWNCGYLRYEKTFEH